MAKTQDLSIDNLETLRKKWRKKGKTVVFTNGCFDLLHYGHVHTLVKAGNLGDILIVGINSDKSIRGLKGEGRPILPEWDREKIVAHLRPVDYALTFDDPDPGALIARLLPDVLVKGGDWAEDEIIGRKVVEENGGRVVRIPLVKDISTSAIIKKIRGLDGGKEG